MAAPIYTGPTQYWESPTVYELDLTAAQGATANGFIQIQADSDFKLIKSTLIGYTTATSITSASNIPLCAVQITDTGSGRQLFSSAVPVSNIFGTGQLPFIWPVPYVFQARSTMAVVLTNFDTTNAFTCRMSFIGTKLFPK